jgi:RNA 2',3'-cyclic 3'-phosphodiesterase
VAVIRAFLALNLNYNAVQTVQRELEPLVQRDFRDLRWIAPGNWHLTLHFFGDMPVEQVEACAPVLTTVGARHAAIALDFDALALFPNLTRANVLALLPARNDALNDLEQDVRESLAVAGFNVERRRFRPHVSVARIKGSRVPEGDDLAFPVAITARFGHMSLMQSELLETGARYTPLLTQALTGAMTAGAAGG